jgi:hypothetical protein
VAKGYSPNVDDPALKRAMMLMQDIENGASIELGDVPALDWSLMKLMKNMIEKHKQKEMETEMKRHG